MPYQTTIGRLTSVEFFAAMPAGLFVFLVSYVYLSNGAVMESSPSLWGSLLQLSDTLKTSPPMILFMFFGAYLFGSIIRSVPVHWAESITRVGRSRFPYADVLRARLEQIEQESGPTGLNLNRLVGNKDLSTAIFNYWKDFLCVRSSEAFAYYQTFEARSRFFTGMFWAGAVGVVGGGAMLSQSYLSGRSYILAAQLLVLSVSLIVAFGLQLRRVREQEAQVLLTLYVAVAHQREFQG